MPDYRWGIFLKPAERDARVGFGDNFGAPAYQEVPGEFRNPLRRIVVTQADTEPASVEQQRRLGHTCPSLYDLRNLFQVNVEEGRHLWAMVYLLHGYFGRDGRDEADALLERRSGNPDKPRILEAFNQPCADWLNFFCFTMFTDRDGKYQLSALAESGFEPLARTCQFMLTEEAHHLFVGETGVGRVVRRTAQLTKQHPDEDVRRSGMSRGHGPEGRREPIRGVRRLIAEHMARAHREIPPVTWVEECDFERVDLDRLIATVLKACAGALPEYPELNARLEGDSVVYLDRYDLGVAVQTDQGLVVPVVRSCDERGLDELAQEVERLAEAARAGKLTPEELRGSTFTVTSAGKLGGLVVTPLINYPEVAILGIHRIAPRPVVREGEIVARDVGNVSVTFDHRVVDGARAAAFCLDVIARLEGFAA